MADDKPAAVGELNFETALQELERIVDQLEAGNVPLERSIEIYERGEQLRKRCDELLKAAEVRIEKVTRQADGAATGVEPLDVDD